MRFDHPTVIQRITEIISGHQVHSETRKQIADLLLKAPSFQLSFFDKNRCLLANNFKL